MHTLEFYFDCSSPWTYLGFESLQQLLTRHQNLSVIYKPILVGGVFNSVNQSVYENRSNPVPIKQEYYLKDLQDWAKHVGCIIGQPPVFPVNSVKAMRGAFYAIEQDLLAPYARAVFKAYWSELKDISQDHVLGSLLEEVGLTADVFFEKIAHQTYKDKLKTNTKELIERGGFGSPTMFLNGDDMFFGNDRLALIEGKLVS